MMVPNETMSWNPWDYAKHITMKSFPTRRRRRMTPYIYRAWRYTLGFQSFQQPFIACHDIHNTYAHMNIFTYIHLKMADIY